MSFYSRYSVICPTVFKDLIKHNKKEEPRDWGGGDTDAQDHLKVFIEVDQDRASTWDTVASNVPEEREGEDAE